MREKVKWSKLGNCIIGKKKIGISRSKKGTKNEAINREIGSVKRTINICEREHYESKVTSCRVDEMG